MLAKLIEDITNATEPSRKLDVTMHEVLTGELNMCKSGVKETSEQKGEILREHGGELLWWPVPLYTTDITIIAKFLADRNLTMMITTHLKKHIEKAVENGQRLKPWSMSAQSETGPCQMVSYTDHAHPGLCAALLALTVISRPVDALTCTNCATSFARTEELKTKLNGISDDQLREMRILCPDCGAEFLRHMQEHQADKRLLTQGFDDPGSY